MSDALKNFEQAQAAVKDGEARGLGSSAERWFAYAEHDSGEVVPLNGKRRGDVRYTEARATFDRLVALIQ